MEQFLGASPITNLSSNPSFNFPSVVASKLALEPHSASTTVVRPATAFQLLSTANLSVESANDEFVAILPSQIIEHATANASTLTEIDVGHEVCQVVTATLCQSQRGGLTPSLTGSAHPQIIGVGPEFWDTSVGRFRFSLEQLPPQLRLIYALLMVSLNGCKRRNKIIIIEHRSRAGS